MDFPMKSINKLDESTPGWSMSWHDTFTEWSTGVCGQQRRPFIAGQNDILTTDVWLSWRIEIRFYSISIRIWTGFNLKQVFEL